MKFPTRTSLSRAMLFALVEVVSIVQGDHPKKVRCPDPTLDMLRATKATMDALVDCMLVVTNRERYELTPFGHYVVSAYLEGMRQARDLNERYDLNSYLWGEELPSKTLGKRSWKKRE